MCSWSKGYTWRAWKYGELSKPSIETNILKAECSNRKFLGIAGKKNQTKKLLTQKKTTLDTVRRRIGFETNRRIGRPPL